MGEIEVPPPQLVYSRGQTIVTAGSSSCSNGWCRAETITIIRESSMTVHYDESGRRALIVALGGRLGLGGRP